MHADGSVRGKRYNPYDKPWKRKCGKEGQHEKKQDLNDSSTNALNEETQDLLGSDGNFSSVIEPTNVLEKGRREKKFGNRSRLYVGNLPKGITEDDLRTLFNEFGETEQVFIEKEKNFGFIRLVRNCYISIKALQNFL